MKDICDLTATEMVSAFKAKELSPVEVTKAVLERAEQCQPKLNAFCHIAHEEALSAAEASEKAWRDGSAVRPLEGVPVSIKDVTTVRGWKLGRGSLTSKGNPPADADSPSVDRLRKAGAVIFASTTSCEGGWKAVTDSPLTGTTRSPYNTALTPGGSSGGAAVAVAVGAGPIALGSDGGGSVRIPASFTGIYGIKPQYGRVPQYPLGPHYANMSHQGPLTRCVDDAALALQVLSGRHVLDADTLPNFRTGDFDEIDRPLAGMRIGVTSDFGFMPVDPQIATAVQGLAGVLETLGAHVVDVPTFADWRPGYRVLWQAGAAQSFRRLPEHLRPLVDEGLQKVAMQGESIALADYLDARMARMALRQQVSEVFGKLDVILSPTVAVLPFGVGKLVPDARFEDWLDWAGISLMGNLTGIPAASLPIGFSAEGLPIGVQICGPVFEDVRVLRVSKALEAAIGGRGGRVPSSLSESWRQ